jgi:Calx-beta domain
MQPRLPGRSRGTRSFCGVLMPCLAIGVSLLMFCVAPSANAGEYIGGPVTIPAAQADFAKADPYPSTVTVSGEKAIILRVTVRVTGFTHPAPHEVDFLLVGPTGRTVLLRSDFGLFAAPGVVMTIEDGGLFPPTDINDGDSDLFPAPAPAGPYGSSLSELAANGANGTWSLYVMDDTAGDGGSITGWQLRISSRDPQTVGARTEQLSPPLGWSEGIGSVRVRVARLAPGAGLQAAAVSFATAPWSFPGSSVAPTPGQDYAPVAGTLEWGAGDGGARTIDIPIIDDSIFEPQESFVVRFSDPAGDLALPSPHELVISIADNDPRPPRPVLRPRLAGLAVQRVLKQRGVTVRARSNVEGTFTATGTITVPGGAAKTVRLKHAQRRVTAGKAVTLKLGLSKKALRTVRRALTVRKKLKARVRLTLRDTSGRKASVAKQLTLKR